MNNPVEHILDLARWAPSGDNEQCWRFEILGDNHFCVYGHDTRDWCVYDLDGRASQTAVGALLETIAIAATGIGFEASFKHRVDSPETQPVVDVFLAGRPEIKPSELLPFIEKRTTQRRSFQRKPLGTEEKRQLEHAIGNNFHVRWLESNTGRWQMARLLFRNAYIRLTIEEAYRVHSKTIEWNARYSEDKMPDQSLGVDNFTLKIMKWAMKSWARVKFLNTYLAGTLLPRVEMDLIPGVCCAAHFAILSKKPLANIEDFFEAGRATQRFWLTCTMLGLQFQPTMTPLIFTRYNARNLEFTTDNKALMLADQLSEDLSLIYNSKDFSDHGVFLGRVGTGRQPESRSLRKPLSKLANIDADKQSDSNDR